MPTTSRPVNRGPAAAAANRAALVDAARRLFSERGFHHVPLHAVARAAGVGQGVLYRHFPDRLDLAFAAFEDNFRLLEAAAEPADAEAFGRVWATLVDLTVREAAFVEMVVEARRVRPPYDGDGRLEALVARTLPAARDAGLVPDDLTVADVQLAWRTVYGVVVTAPDATAAARDVRSLAPTPGLRGATRRPTPDGTGGTVSLPGGSSRSPDGPTTGT